MTEVALARLADLVAHQGHLDPAAPDIVPGLWQIAAEADGTDRAAAVVLLGDLAAGGSHQHLLGMVSSDEAPPGLLEGDLRERVIAGAGVCEPWLSDPSPHVRAAAGFVLAVTESVASSVALVAAAASESDPACACDLRIAAGWLLARSGEAFPALPEDVPDIIVAGDALGRAYAAMDEDAVWELYELLGEPQRSTDSLWADGDHTAHAVALLARHAERSGNLGVLTDALDLAPAGLVPKVALPMLRVVFDDALLAVDGAHEPTPPSRSQLTHAQFDVLRLLQSREDVWSLELRDTLLALGLEDSPVKLRRYLRVKGVPSILDRVIVIDGDAQRLRRCWQMACLRRSTAGPGLAAALVDQLTPEEVVQAVIMGGRKEVASVARGYELELLILFALGCRSPVEIERQLRRWYSTGVPDYIDDGGLTRGGEYMVTVFWLTLWRLRSSRSRRRCFVACIRRAACSIGW